MTIIEIALALFFTLNALGNLPLIIALLSAYSSKRQAWILFREMLFGLALLLFFCFFGQNALRFLQIDASIMRIAGGIILFLLALSMIFPKIREGDPPPIHEPFIVPIATPIIVGPGTLAMVTVFSYQIPSAKLFVATVSAWIATTLVLLSSALIKRWIPTPILLGLGRLMGLLLALIATEMEIKGLVEYFGR